MALPRAKQPVLPDELDGVEYQGFPTLLPRQNEAYGKLLQGRPGSYTVLGYGGGMGGGKSIFLSTICNQFALSFPGTRILLCRDTLKALKESTLLDFMSMLPRQLILKYNQGENWVRIRRETWPEGVYSQITFMGVHDYEAIGSAAYQIILLDEAHEIPSAAARFLLTRLRWQLPKAVRRSLATQCRYVARGEDDQWIPCGKRVMGSCPEHGDEWVSDQVPYYFVATANPWPGWYADWFAKGEMGDSIAALGADADVSVHFVQSLMRDNHHLPRNYEALASAGLTPEERRRFIDGEFGVFTGMVYEAFDKKAHAWNGPIPPYTRVIGGLDFGNESSSGHYTAGVVQLVTPSRRVLLVDEFKKRGPKVYEQQALWMQAMEEKWGKPIGKKIEWRGDKNQSVGLKYMRDTAGFNTTKSNKSGLDSVDGGIRHVATFLNFSPGTYPSFFYLPEGHELGGCPEWEKEIREYRRDPETLKVVKERDDVMDAWRYSFELLGSLTGDPAQLFKNALPAMVA